MGVVAFFLPGRAFPLAWWGLMSCPALAFVPSVIAAVKLHRTTDPDQTKALWRRSLLLAMVGTVMLVGAAAVIQRTFP